MATQPTRQMRTTTPTVGTQRSATTIDPPATEQVTQKAKETVGQVADTAKQQADSQRERLAGGLNHVAEGLRQTAQTMRERDQELVGEYANKAANQVERAAGYMSEHSVDQIIGDVQDFARREPALVLGGAFALGFLAARFLKAGGRSSGVQAGYQPMSRQTMYSSRRISNGG
jgi:uncharacterized protein YjbJ (UPF0337 family)